MLHLVHVLHSLDVGGTENGVVNLIGALRRGFRHTVVSMTGAGPLAARLPAGVSVHCLAKRPGLDPRAFIRLVTLLRRLSPHVVHSRNWAAFDAVPAARLAGIATVIHGEHGREITDPEGRNPRRNRLRRLLAPLVTRFVAVSDDLARWLVERVGVPARQVVTILNGVDTERFSPDAREEGRRILGVSNEAVVLGTVARLDPVKDQAGLLEAFALVARDHPYAAAVLVGDGPSRMDLAERVRVLGIEGRAKLLGSRADVPTLLPGFDVFVLPSIAEGMSNTVLEAMATGLPVVATRTGGNPELVEDGVTGALVPVRDPRRLAEAVSAYLGDAHLRALHGKAGRQRVLEAFSLERMAEAYRKLYLSLAADERGRRA